MDPKPHGNRRPEVDVLLAALERHGVRYVLVGSVAAQLHGATVDPGDLDVVPSTDHANLDRLGAVLGAIEGWPAETYGHWESRPDDEWAWVADEPTDARRAAWARWSADPGDPGTFDHLFTSLHGNFDVVPLIAGTFDELRPRAQTVHRAGLTVQVAHVADLLAKLTAPRRAKDVGRVRELRAIQRAERPAP